MLQSKNTTCSSIWFNLNHGNKKFDRARRCFCLLHFLKFYNFFLNKTKRFCFADRHVHFQHYLPPFSTNIRLGWKQLRYTNTLMPNVVKLFTIVILRMFPICIKLEWLSMKGLSISQCYETFYVRNLRIFIIIYSVCPWQAFLLFVGEVRSLPQSRTSERFFNMAGSCFTIKHQTRMGKLTRDKHASLLRKFITYSHKKVYNIGPRLV